MRGRRPAAAARPGQPGGPSPVTEAVATEDLLDFLHDVRNDLAALSMAVAVVLAEPGLPDAATERLHQVEGEIGRLVHGLQTVVEQPAEWAACDLAAVVTQCVELARLRGEVAIELTADAAWVIGHETSLRRAVANILDNALRAAARAGSIRVTVAANREVASVRVQDDGPGFGRARPGTGSRGLRIVQGIVRRHGGQVSIDLTQPGTAVTLEFPVLARAAEREE